MPALVRWELRLPEPLQLTELAEAALEDYAREVLRGSDAEVVRPVEDGPVVALWLAGLAAPPSPQAQGDVVAFARELAAAGGAPRLGWS
jgi:hypothetical protein